MSLILIDNTGKCFCNCAMTCVVQHKSGMQPRCTKEEIENAGFKTAQVYGPDSERAVRDFICIDGYEKKLQIRSKRV